MALKHSNMGSLGTPAIKFDLLGTDDQRYSLDNFSDQKVLVIIFMCNHCPYVKAVLQRLINLQDKWMNYEVQFVGINSNDTVKYPDDSMNNMKKIVKEKMISFPYLLDETQEVARAYGAVCTPDIFVYGQERTLLYQGRLDNNWQDLEKVTRNDLDDAIQLTVDDESVFEDQVASMGCSIKWKNP
jgi:peroxiredoxin|tara:strand:- start:188 stop:742 length:555 start_codon:yes stop_codon:yes gene_type:complete